MLMFVRVLLLSASLFALLSKSPNSFDSANLRLAIPISLSALLLYLISYQEHQSGFYLLSEPLVHFLQGLDYYMSCSLELYIHCYLWSEAIQPPMPAQVASGSLVGA